MDVPLLHFAGTKSCEGPWEKISLVQLISGDPKSAGKNLWVWALSRLLDVPSWCDEAIGTKNVCPLPQAVPQEVIQKKARLLQMLFFGSLGSSVGAVLGQDESN